MKVLLANKFFYPKGGAETVFLQERSYLLSHGHTVFDFSMQDPRNLPSRDAPFFVPPADYHARSGWLARLCLAARLVHNGPAVRQLRRLLARERPDLAHLHNIYHQITPAIIPVLKQAGIPVVLTAHDYKLVCPTYDLLRADGTPCADVAAGGPCRLMRCRCKDGFWSRSALLAIEARWQRMRGSYHAVDRVLAPSEFMAGCLRRGGFSADRVQVLPNGVDVPPAFPDDPDDGYALFLGRISPEKGLPFLLEAAARLGPRWPLRIAGDGPMLEALRRAHPEAEFTGHVTGDARARLLRRCACVVVPSTWYENFSMTVLEAMAAGKPVVASRIGGLPEQIADGQTGRLVPAGDATALAEALHELAADPARRRTMGRAAWARAARDFSAEAHGRGLLAVYDDLWRNRAAS